MSHELKEGVVCSAIAGTLHPQGNLYYKVDAEGAGYWAVKSIVIAEQAGDMGMVPFAKVTFHDGQTSFHNIHNLETIVLPPPEGADHDKGTDAANE